MLVFPHLCLSSLSFISICPFSLSLCLILLCVTSYSFPACTNHSDRFIFLFPFRLMWLSFLQQLYFSLPCLSISCWAHFDHLWFSSSYFNLSTPLIWSLFSEKVCIQYFFLVLWKSIWTHLCPALIMLLMYAFPFILSFFLLLISINVNVYA